MLVTVFARAYLFAGSTSFSEVFRIKSMDVQLLLIYFGGNPIQDGHYM